METNRSSNQHPMLVGSSAWKGGDDDKGKAACLSRRGQFNLANIMCRIPKPFLEAGQRVVAPSPIDCFDEVIDLSMAENWLIRPEVMAIYKTAIETYFSTEHLSFPLGFWGDPGLLTVLATLFNSYFQPNIAVRNSHITIAPGSSGCLDALLYNICDSGDGVLVPSPYWNGNNVFFQIRAMVSPVPVETDDFLESMETSIITALENAYLASSHNIKALVLSNPHNPLGRCYTKEVLEKCVKFCHKRGIDLISDEVFALSVFHSAEMPNETRFTSVLSLDVAALGGDPSRVHVVWSPSKDFGSSGIRIGCTITQANEEMRNALSLAAHVNVSTLSVVAIKQLLSSATLPKLLALSSTRLEEAYAVLTSFLKAQGIQYLPCNAGTFLCAKIAPHVKSWEEEAEFVQKLRDVGVSVGPGARYHISEMGWARICFAVPKPVLDEALKRIAKAL